MLKSSLIETNNFSVNKVDRHLCIQAKLNILLQYQELS